MYDNSLHFSVIADQKTQVLKQLGLEGKPYALATLHRDSNTDDHDRLMAILEAFTELSKTITVVLPMHPRTRKMVEQLIDNERLPRFFHSKNILITEPVSFLEMIQLEKHSQLILTDSGGVQKESYFFKKPCVILRSETEWIEIVETGAATLADADKTRILEASGRYLQQPPDNFPEIFGNGHAAEFMLEQIITNLEQKA